MSSLTIADDLNITVSATGTMKTKEIFNVNLMDDSSEFNAKDITEVILDENILTLKSRLNDNMGNDISGLNIPYKPATIALNSRDAQLEMEDFDKSSIRLNAQYINIAESETDIVNFNNAEVINLNVNLGTPLTVTSTFETPPYEQTIYANTFGPQDFPSSIILQSAHSTALDSNSDSGPGPDRVRIALVTEGNQLSLVVEKWDNATNQWLPGATLMALS